MDVRLSAEQRTLRDSAAQLVDRLGPHAVGELDDAERIAKLDAAVAAAGWRELRTADDDGAPWASGVEVGIVAEELGRGLVDVPFLGPTLAAELRRLTGAPPASSPETIALTPDLSALACATDGIDRASGAATPAFETVGEQPFRTQETVTAPPSAVAIDARDAASALVLVPTTGGYALAQVAVPNASAGVDLTRPTVALRPSTDAAPGGGRAVAALAGQGRVLTEDDLARWMALGVAVTCADLVGTMRGAVRLATEYAKERRQYGRTIGSFQAVQHLLADTHVATEGSHSAALHAAWAVDALPPDEALAAAAVAKAYCARAARTVCETAIQVHGGIGNTWECLAHVYLRRALLSTDVLGGVGPSLARVLAHHGIDHGIGQGNHSGIGDQRGLR